MRSRGPSEGRDSFLAGDRLKVGNVARETGFGSKRASRASFNDKIAGPIQTKARGAMEYAPTPEPDSAENLFGLQVGQRSVKARKGSGLTPTLDYQFGLGQRGVAEGASYDSHRGNDNLRNSFVRKKN